MRLLLLCALMLRAAAAHGQAAETAATVAPVQAAATAPATPEAEAVDDEALLGAEVIVITAARAPEAVRDAAVTTRVVSRDELRGAGAETAAQALAMQPGVWIQRGLGGAEAHLHGLGGKHVLVLVDGQRQLGRVDGVLDLDRFATADLEQIEITSGPSSVLYGSEALGGVIQLVRRRPREDRAELEARYASDRASSMFASGAYVHRGAFASAHAQWRRAPAIDRDSSDESTTISAYDERRVELRLGAPPAARVTRAELGATYVRRRLEGVLAMPTGAVLDRTNLVEEASGRALGELNLGELELSTSAGVALVRDQYLSDQRGAADLDQVQDTRELALEASALAQRSFEKLVIAAGLEGVREQLRSPRLAQEGERSRLAAFAQARWTLGELSVVPAVRLDLDSQFGAHATPRLAALWQPTARQRVRGSLGFGYRAPSFKELLLRFENPGAGYVVEGNPDLDPETSRALALGWQGEHGRLSAAVDASWNELRSMITAVAMPAAEGEPLRFGYDNLARARTLDLEVHASYALERLTFTAGAAATYSRDLDDGAALPQVPAYRARAALRWRHDGLGLAADAELAVTAARALTDEMEAPRRLDARARVAKDFPSLSFSLGVDNLFDAGDATFDPSAPRTFYLGVQATR